MATGWSTITKENTNFARLSKLLIDGGTHALRVIFDAEYPPHDLKKHLMDSRIQNILKNLMDRKILQPEQWNKLFPSVGSATSADFDITLLCLLLRNICNLKTPANGWDKEPAATSVNVEDDVVRLRLYRNNLYGHISEPALSDADFNKYWNDIETVLLRHGVNKADIDSLKTQSFDQEDYYIKFLKEWITDAVKELEKRVPDEIDSGLVKEKLLEKVVNIEPKLDEERKLKLLSQTPRPITEGAATSASFWITLLMATLRNICNLITLLVKGWNNKSATSGVLRNNLDIEMPRCIMVIASQQPAPLPRGHGDDEW